MREEYIIIDCNGKPTGKQQRFKFLYDARSAVKTGQLIKATISGNIYNSSGEKL